MNPVSREQLSAYLDGALSAEEKARVDQALAESPNLRTELARLRALGQLIKSVPTPEPPPDFYVRVLNKTQPRPHRWTTWSIPLVTAMAASLVMVYVFHDSKRTNDSLQPQQLMGSIAPQPASEFREYSMKDISVHDRHQADPEREPKSLSPISTKIAKPQLARRVQADSKRVANQIAQPDDEIALKTPVLPSAPAKAKGSGRLDSLTAGSYTADAEQSLKKKEIVSGRIPNEPRSMETQISPFQEKAKRSDSPAPREWRGTSSGITDVRLVVIRSAKEWEDLWAQHQSIQYPPKPVPTVDFEKEMVVGVFSGDKGSSGYETTIRDIVVDPTEIRVHYHLSTPEKQTGMGFLAVMTQPYHLKMVPRSDLPVRFVEQ